MLDILFPDGLPPSPIERIRSKHLPILLYGMGNGAEKAASLMQSAGLGIDGVFASDGFRSGKSFLGHNVFPASELAERYPAGFIALVTFGCPDGDMRMYLGRVKRAGGQIFMPHLPLFGGPVFCANSYNQHKEEIGEVYSLLSDERSKSIFRSLLRYFLTWNPEELFLCETNALLLPGALSGLSVKKAIDGGAYRGDSAREFFRFFPALKQIVAFEPDSVNFSRLTETELPGVRFDALPYGLWSSPGSLSFSASHNRGAHFSPGYEKVPVTSIDATPQCSDADLIKLDVEGCETEALTGAKELICSRKPALLLSVYHKTEDFFRLPLMVARYGGYRLHFLREPVCPAWDIRLLAVPETE